MKNQNRNEEVPKRFMVRVENENRYLRMLNHLERNYGLNMADFCNILLKYYWDDRVESRPAINRVLEKHLQREREELEAELKPSPVVKGKLAFI